MTRDQINQLWTESTTVADFLIAIGVVQVEEPSDLANEFHPDIINRARNNADAPYNQKTCSRYPAAAAARIAVLEYELRKLKLEAIRPKGEDRIIEGELFREQTPERGVIRLTKYTDVYQLWYHGELVWRSAV